LRFIRTTRNFDAGSRNGKDRKEAVSRRHYCITEVGRKGENLLEE